MENFLLIFLICLTAICAVVSVINLILNLFVGKRKASDEAVQSVFSDEERIKLEKIFSQTDNIMNYKPNREELTQGFNHVAEELRKNSDSLTKEQQTLRETVANEMRTVKDDNIKTLYSITKDIRQSIEGLQRANDEKLEKMRLTVDEKLQSTLETRLSSSFESVNKQLATLHQAVGQVTELSNGISDLQKVLSNVKTRGTWSEVRLESILSDILTSEQYVSQYQIKKTKDAVDFAVRIPNKYDDGETFLPIDSKFPQEDYIRLCDTDQTDKKLYESAKKSFEASVEREAKSISEKYINVPYTTNFAIMFLGTEGLYSEVAKINGLMEKLQNKYSITVCGPSTITAFLNTLQVGFRMMTISKKTDEVWKLLSAIKAQYERFGKLLEKARSHLDIAGKSLGEAVDKNSYIQTRLKKVGEIDGATADGILGISEGQDVSVGENDDI